MQPLDGDGRVVLSKRLKRDGVVPFVAALPPCGVAMEACFGAHDLGRRLIELGYDARLIAPQYVRPYVKSQKNDDRDAEALANKLARIAWTILAGGGRYTEFVEAR